MRAEDMARPKNFSIIAPSISRVEPGAITIDRSPSTVELKMCDTEVVYELLTYGTKFRDKKNRDLKMCSIGNCMTAFLSTLSNLLTTLTN